MWTNKVSIKVLVFFTKSSILTRHHQLLTLKWRITGGFPGNLWEQFKDASGNGPRKPLGTGCVLLTSDPKKMKEVKKFLKSKSVICLAFIILLVDYF